MATAACGGESVVAPAVPALDPGNVAAAIGTDPRTGATIETNQDDYSPGEVVHLTGRGWAPNETVHLFMTEAPDTHGDVTQSVVADASGAFTLHFYDVQPHDLGVEFTLTATGATSGSKAVVVFTDGRQLQAINLSPPNPPPGATVPVTLDVILNSGAGPTVWKGTKWAISNSAGTVVLQSAGCVNSIDHSVGDPDTQSGNKHQNTFIFVAPAAGSYTILAEVYSDDTCSSSTDATSRTLTFTIGSPNAVPLADAEAGADPNAYAGDEGSAIAIAGSGSDPDGGAAVTFLWTAAAVSGTTGSCSFAAATSASTTVTCTDNGSYTLTLKVTDDENTFTTSTATLAVANVAPATPTITAPSSVNESSTPFNFSASSNDVSSADVAAGLTFAFSCDDGATFGAFSTSSSGQCAAPDGPSTVKIAVKAKDKDGGESLVAKHSVTVANVAPTATFNVPASANSGASFQIALVSPVDPSSADVSAGFEYAFDCGSGTFGAYSATATATCTAGLPPSMTVKGKIKDKDGGETIYEKSVAVNTVPPLANAGGPYSGNEASVINISGSGSDPDGGAAVTFLWTATANSPAVGSCTFASASSASTTVNCTDNGTYTLTLTVTDDENTSTQSTATLTVANVAPATPTITAPSSVNESSVPFNFSASTTDVSSVDVAAGFKFAFSCDDGATFGTFSTSSSGQCAAPDGPSTVKIAVKAMDKDGGVSGVAKQSVTVNNVAPTATFGNNGPVNEGSPFTLTLTNPADVAADLGSLTYAFDCGSGYGSYGSSTSAVCPTTDNGTRSVKGKVKDKDGGESEYTASVTVNNVAPTATFTSPTAANEGATFQLSFSGATDVSSADVAAGFTYAYDCGTGLGTPSTATSHDCTALDGVTPPVGTTVKGRVYDKDGGFTEYTGSVTISNVAPTATFGNTGPVDEGSSFTLTLTDPVDVPADLGSLQYAFDCGSGYGAFGATASASCPTTDNGSRSVKGKVQDKDGGVTEYTASVTVNNVAPTVTATNAPASVNEGASIPFSATTVTDPSTADQTAGFTFAYSCDGTTYGAYQAASYVHSCPAVDGPESVPVYVKAKDKDGGVSAPFSQQVTVNNVAPTLNAIGSTIALAAVNQTVNITLDFSDPAGTYDTYQAVVNWDDGLGHVTAPGTISSVATVSRTFSAPGVYRVCAKVKDSDLAESNELCYEYLVVYDPTGGFVTGGGWINSPLGAYRADLTLTGKATFGFVSKYLKGANTPTGNTEFQFHAGRLNFSSTSYQWLVVSGPQAQFKGVGTVNGAAGYGFLLSARDGSPDKFRIKIWLVSTGEIVYDNQVSGSTLDDAEPATALGGGSIVIHNR